MEDSFAVGYAIIAAIAVLYVIRWRSDRVCCVSSVCHDIADLAVQRQLSSIPTVGGPSAPILSYLTALKFLRNGKELIVQGNNKVYIMQSSFCSKS